MLISSQSPGSAPVKVMTSAPAALAQEQDFAEKKAVEEARDGIRITLSERSRTQAGRTGKGSDIDDSDLPNTIKQLIKMIRALKQQIAEKQAELAALMQEGLDAKALNERAQIIQTELATLLGALTCANASLAQAMRQEAMSPEQIQTAMSLIMK